MENVSTNSLVCVDRDKDVWLGVYEKVITFSIEYRDEYGYGQLRTMLTLGPPDEWSLRICKKYDNFED